jgi:hypothetical protein
MNSLFPSQFVNNPEALYRWCNERYWQSELPNDVDVIYVESKGNSGSFTAKGRNRPHHAITIPAKLKNDPEKLLSILVHRQIHVWQATMANKNNDSSYLDTDIPEWMQQQHEKGRKMRRYHGPSFHSQMTRLNGNFSELNIAIDCCEEPELLYMEESVSIMHVIGRRPNGTRGDGVYWCTSPFTQVEKDALNAWVEETYHDVVNIRFGHSIASEAKSYARLSNGALPKSSQQPVLYKPSSTLGKFLDGDDLTQWETPRPASALSSTL